jgi:hypothetical protein
MNKGTTKVIGVEKKRPKRGNGQPWPSRLTPAELEARRAALELERDHQYVLAALKARGEPIPALSARELRAHFTTETWNALVEEGRRLTHA